MNIFKKAICAFLTVAMLVPLGSGFAAEGDAEKVTLIVQMESGSTVEQMAEVKKKGITPTEECEQKITNSILREQRAVQRDIVLTVDTDINFGYNYTAALNGFSMEADDADVPYIKALDGVKNVYISRSHPLTDPVSNNERAIHTDYGAVMAKVTSLHEQGYKGEGAVIAIIDTEFDTNHEFLSGSVTNPRLSKNDIAEAISDLELNANVTVNRAWKNEKIPFAYNYTYETADTFNNDPDVVHGTHVAGIAAGKNGKLPNGDTFDGTAPEAQLLCLAVPNLEDHHCIAAIDDAIKLGADVLNLSWGADYTEPGLYDDVFSNALLSGVFLANAAGNSGIGYENSLPPASVFDYGAMGNPADSSLATTVASADNPKEWSYSLHIFADGTEIEKVREQNYDYPFSNAIDGEDGVEYVMCGTNYDYDGDLTDKIAVFDYSESYSDEQIFNTARKCGAIGVILIIPDELFDEDFLVIYNYMMEMPTVTVPASTRHVLEDGSRIIARVLPTLAGGDERDLYISFFSAWGVFSSLKLDPNITAMGGMIYSSIPDDEYDTYDGTSMATPQVSGSAALLKEYLSKNEPSFNELTPHEKILEIENRMMSTAETLYCYDDNGDLIPESPRHQGAGLLNVDAAAKTPVVLTGTDGRTKIELGDKLSDDISFTFTVKNLSDSPATYIDISMCIFTNDTNSGTVMEFGDKLNTVNVSLPQSVTVPAGESVDVDVSFTLDAEQVGEIEKEFVNGFFVDGFVFLKSDSDAPALAIPFMGFHGDWDGGPLLDTEGWLKGGIKLGSGISYHMYNMNFRNHLVDGCDELGRNRIIDKHSWEVSHITDPDNVYHDESFAGVSPDGDEHFDYVCMSLVPLRRIDRALYELKDSDGNVLVRREVENRNGLMERFTAFSYMFSYDELKEAGADKEGDYSVTTTVWRNGTAQPQTVIKSFYVDTTKPIVKSFEMIENGRIFIEMSDNRHLMGVEVTDANTDEWLTARPLDAPNDCGTVIDVSRWLDRPLKVSVYDYADNKTSVFYGIGAGDINGDGEISNVDLVLLARYLVHLEDFYIDLIRKSDFNTDGLVDNLDLVELARYLVSK